MRYNIKIISVLMSLIMILSIFTVVPVSVSAAETTAMAPTNESTEAHIHALYYVDQVDADPLSNGVLAHYECRNGCGKLFIDSLGDIEVNAEDLRIPYVPPTESLIVESTVPEPTEPTEAPEPTEPPTDAYEPTTKPITVPKDCFIVADDNLYPVYPGEVHTYSFYLDDGGIICGIDGATVWDPEIKMVSADPSFPILGGNAPAIDPGMDYINGDGNPIPDTGAVYNYFNDGMGTLTGIDFNWTNPEGADFGTGKGDVITFTIKLDENAAPGYYCINTNIKTLEGLEEERQIFEDTDVVDPPVRRDGELDGQPGEKLPTRYIADEQTYYLKSSEEKTFTANRDTRDDLTFGKFRSLWIDSWGDGYYTLVDYPNYTKESGSLKLTLRPDFMEALEAGDYSLKFVFSDGEAIGILHIVEGSDPISTPDQPYHPDYPYYGDGKIHFDAASAGWSGAYAISFYIYEIGGYNLTEWGSKNKSLTSHDGDIWSFDAIGAGVQNGKEYAVIFLNLDTNACTADLLFDTSCLGDTAYVPNPDDKIENAVDSNKKSMIARWRGSSLGPLLQITSLGNIIGESIPSTTSAYQMMVNFLASKGAQSLTNALNFNGKDAQTTIDDTAKALGLTKADVAKAIAEAKDTGANNGSGDKTDWTNSWDASRSTLPGTIEPIEPPTDRYGYVVGGYYLAGTINGNDNGTANVDPKLRFRTDTDSQMILSDVILSEGDSVKVVRYNGGNTFTVYPDGIGRDVLISDNGFYDFYFKPYELGNPNYWFITPSFVKEVLFGDANGDGEVNSIDVTCIQRYCSGLKTGVDEETLMSADVDHNGLLEIIDATWIQRYVAKMEIPYTIG